MLVILVLATTVLVSHELLHGLAIRYYGGEPTYGVGIGAVVGLGYAFLQSYQRANSRTEAGPGSAG